MTYAAILAGGSGTRINTLDYPKQFYKLDGKPIIIYTLEKFVYSDNIDLVYLAINVDYMDYMKELLEQYDLGKNVIVVPGGDNRMGSIDNVISVIAEGRQITEEDIILIHDAVRPFITEKIIIDSIDGVKEHGATVATIPAVDTIIASKDGVEVFDIPNRSELFSGQSPDSFKLKEFIEMQGNLTEEQKSLATGTSQVCTFNNKKIFMVKGDPINFKITTDTDLVIAKAIVEEGKYEKPNRNSKRM